MNLRRVADSFEQGYDWPLDYNRDVRAMGFDLATLPVEPEPRRAWRGIVWAFATLREELSDAIHPDGPR